MHHLPIVLTEDGSPPLDQIIFQDVKTAHHLREDEHFVAACDQLGEQFIN